LPLSAAAQAVPTYPGDSITARARPAHPVYVSPGPIAPTLPGDTLLGGALSYKAAVPLHPVAPTMPGDVITQPPQWVLDTLRADSIRQGLIPADSADTDGREADSLDTDGREADSLDTDSLETDALDAAPLDPGSARRDSAAAPGFQVLPDARERADSLRLEGSRSTPQSAPVQPSRTRDSG